MSQNKIIVVYDGTDSEVKASLLSNGKIQVDRYHCEYRRLPGNPEEELIVMSSVEIITRKRDQEEEISLKKEFERLKVLSDDYYRQYQQRATDKIETSLDQIKNCSGFSRIWEA